MPIRKHTLPHATSLRSACFRCYNKHLTAPDTGISLIPQSHSPQSSEVNRTGSSWRSEQDEKTGTEAAERAEAQSKTRPCWRDRSGGIRPSSQNEPPSFESPFCIPDTALGSTDNKLNYHDDTVHHVSYVDTNQSSGIQKGP